MSVENPDVRQEGRKWRDYTAWLLVLGVVLCVAMFVYALAATGFGGVGGPTYPDRVPTPLPNIEGRLLLWRLIAAG